MSNMYRQKILNMIRQGGRETTLSLATDDLIQEGGLGIVDEDLLYNPERQEELEQVVVDNYMNILNSSANSGYAKKQAAVKKSQASSSSTAYKYGQSTRDDLQIYSSPAKETYGKLKSKLKEINSSGMNDPIELKVAEINKIMKGVNPEFQEVLIDPENTGSILYRDSEGYDVALDLSNDENVINFVINNIGEGIGDDAKMILRQQLKGLKTSNSKSKPVELTQEEQDALF